MTDSTPLGLAWSDEIFATTRDDAMPIEQFNCVSALIAACSRCAALSGGPCPSALDQTILRLRRRRRPCRDESKSYYLWSFAFPAIIRRKSSPCRGFYAERKTAR